MYIPYGHLVVYHRQEKATRKKEEKMIYDLRVPYTDPFSVTDQKTTFFPHHVT